MEAFTDDIEKVLIPEAEIQAKLAEMGEKITADYRDRSLLLVGVLKGAFVVMADLARHIDLPLQFDFMAVSSYGAATKTSGVVRILKDLDHDLRDRDVLVVEDIVDSGLTQVPLDVRYVGFDIPNEFVVGYGLDYAEKYRNLPFIGMLKPSAYAS
jgi:hypoxanthine phosphoribosyltransferase